MIFLDYHPDAPTVSKAAKRTSNSQSVPTKLAMKNDDNSWQLKWMMQYDSLRKEFQDRLQKSEEISEQKLSEIEALQNQMKKIPKLEAKIIESEKIIHELKKECKKLQLKVLAGENKTTQTDTNIVPIDAYTQTEIMKGDQCVQTLEIAEAVNGDDNQRVDDTLTMEIAVSEDFVQKIYSHAQTDEIVNDDQNADDMFTMEITVSDDYVRNIHSYAKTGEFIPKVRQFKYKCVDCKFATNKKSNFHDHKTENCVEKPKKNMKCPICNRSFTYRTLRHHLNYYATGKFKAHGKHATHTPIHHAFLLEQHKRLKTKQ